MSGTGELYPAWLTAIVFVMSILIWGGAIWGEKLERQLGLAEHAALLDSLGL